MAGEAGGRALSAKGMLAEIYWHWLMQDAGARAVATQTPRMDGESVWEWRRRVEACASQGKRDDTR